MKMMTDKARLALHAEVAEHESTEWAEESPDLADLRARDARYLRWVLGNGEQPLPVAVRAMNAHVLLSLVGELTRDATSLMNLAMTLMYEPHKIASIAGTLKRHARTWGGTAREDELRRVAAALDAARSRRD